MKEEIIAFFMIFFIVGTFGFGEKQGIIFEVVGIKVMVIGDSLTIYLWRFVL
jgi:hypothetical protein